MRRARERLPRGAPLLWSEEIGALDCVVPGCRERLPDVRVADLLRDPARRDAQLDALPLVVTRDGEATMLPDDDMVMLPGDVLLLCGTRRARHRLHATLRNPYTLHFLTTGEDPPRSWFFQWLCRRIGAPRALPAAR